MANEVISYLEMCGREGTSLQRGMNFGLGGDHSVVLMSVRPNAPYRDRLEDNGTTIIYEGHDELQSASVPHPKAVDQPYHTAYGNLTQNGRFHEAAQGYKDGLRPPERVRVYEKLRQGIWSYNGVFLVDSWQQEVFQVQARRGQGGGRPQSSVRTPSRPEEDHSNVREAGRLETRQRQVRCLRRDGRLALRSRIALLERRHLDH
jgi:hypothetical protein